MSEKLPDSFDNAQPDLPTLAVDPDPEVTEDGHTGPKYPTDLPEPGEDTGETDGASSGDRS